MAIETKRKTARRVARSGSCPNRKLRRPKRSQRATHGLPCPRLGDRRVGVNSSSWPSRRGAFLNGSSA